MQDTIGTDISKDTLDCFELPSSRHSQYSNDDLGQKGLIKWIKSQDVALVVFEATIARQGMRSMPEREVPITAVLRPHWQSINAPLQR